MQSISKQDRTLRNNKKKKRHIRLYVQQSMCEKKNYNKDSTKFTDLEKIYLTLMKKKSYKSILL